MKIKKGFEILFNGGIAKFTGDFRLVNNRRAYFFRGAKDELIGVEPDRIWMYRAEYLQSILDKGFWLKTRSEGGGDHYTDIVDEVVPTNKEWMTLIDGNEDEWLLEHYTFKNGEWVEDEN